MNLDAISIQQANFKTRLNQTAYAKVRIPSQTQRNTRPASRVNFDDSDPQNMEDELVNFENRRLVGKQYVP